MELVEPLAMAAEAVAAGRLGVDLVKTLKWRAEFHQLVPGIHPFELQDLLQLEPERQSEVASQKSTAGRNTSQRIALTVCFVRNLYISNMRLGRAACCSGGGAS